MPQPAAATPRALYWPDGQRPPERPAVYWAFCALILAGFVAGCALHAAWMLVSLAAFFGLIEFHQRNGRATAEQIAEQLRERPSFPGSAWGSEDRAAFAAAVSLIVADEFDWPSPHFLPDDPLEIILFHAGGDGGEGLAISYNFEKAFGRRCRFGDDQTIGEFIDRNDGPAAAKQHDGSAAAQTQ